MTKVLGWLVVVLFVAGVAHAQPKTPYDEPKTPAAPPKAPAAPPKAPAAPPKAAPPKAPASAPPAASSSAPPAPPPPPASSSPAAPPTTPAPPVGSTAPTPSAAPPTAPPTPPLTPLPLGVMQAPLPGGQPFPRGGPPPDEQRPRGPDAKLIVGIISAVLGAGALVTFGVSQAQITSLEEDTGFMEYRRGLTPSQSACDEAAGGRRVARPGALSPAEVDDLCSTGRTYEILSYVMLPAGVVLLGVGGFLIFTSDTVRNRNRASVELIPRVGWNAASADVVVRY